MCHTAARREAMLALLKNDIQLFPIGLSVGMGHLREGKVTALAVAAAEAPRMLPGVPTMAKPGFLASPHPTGGAWRHRPARRTSIADTLYQGRGRGLAHHTGEARFLEMGMVAPEISRQQFAASLKRKPRCGRRRSPAAISRSSSAKPRPRFIWPARSLKITPRRTSAYGKSGVGMSKTVRRIVTGHDKDGTAVVIADATIDSVTRAAGVASALLWVTDETPADISGSKDRADRTIGVPPPMNGSILRIVDFPPVTGDIKVDNAAFTAEMGIGAQHRRKGKYTDHPFMHRTKSIDYAIVLEGEIDMLLDDSKVHLKAGDILVQQGTNHAWVNTGKKTCRIAFVLIGAHEPDVLKGVGGGH